MSELKLEKRHVGRPRKQTLVGTLQEFCSCTHMKILHTDTVQENHGFCIVRDCRCEKFTWVREAVASSEILNPQVNHSVKRFPDLQIPTENGWEKINKTVEDYDLRKNNPFPRIPHDKKRSTALTLDQIEQVRKLFNNGKGGYGYTDLGRMFNCSRVTIKYWVNQNWHEQEKLRSLEKAKRREKDAMKDPVLYKRMREIDNDYHLRIRDNSNFLKWEKNSATRYKKMNLQKVLEAHRRWRAKNHDKEMIRWKRYRDKKRAMKNFRLFQEYLVVVNG